MEAMRQTWTDDRMDDLAAQVEAGFAQARVDLGSTREELRREIKEQGEELRGEIKTQGDELRAEIKAQGKELRGEIKELGKELRSEIQALAAIVAAGQRTMLQICGALGAAAIAALTTLIVAVL